MAKKGQEWRGLQHTASAVQRKALRKEELWLNVMHTTLPANIKSVLGISIEYRNVFCINEHIGIIFVLITECYERTPVSDVVHGTSLKPRHA